MAEQGTSAPTEIATSETPALPEPLSLDDLSLAQAQRVLEATLQQYHAVDESRVVDAGTSAAVPSLTNVGLTTPLTASGEQRRLVAKHARLLLPQYVLHFFTGSHSLVLINFHNIPKTESPPI